MDSKTFFEQIKGKKIAFCGAGVSNTPLVYRFLEKGAKVFVCDRRTREQIGPIADEFEKKGAAVIGISKDSAASHARFAEKHNLPFILLSDPDLEAIKAYGVWQEKKLYGKVSFGVVRTTFIINEEGKIEKILPKVNPDKNASEVLEML